MVYIIVVMLYSYIDIPSCLTIRSNKSEGNKVCSLSLAPGFLYKQVWLLCGTYYSCNIMICLYGCPSLPTSKAQQIQGGQALQSQSSPRILVIVNKFDYYIVHIIVVVWYGCMDVCVVPTYCSSNMICMYMYGCPSLLASIKSYDVCK